MSEQDIQDIQDIQNIQDISDTEISDTGIFDTTEIPESPRVVDIPITPRSFEQTEIPEYNEFMERKCGGHINEDTIKKVNNAVQKALNKCAIEDDGEPMYIDVVVHICYQDSETPESIADIDAMIKSLNDDYNGNSTNFDNDRTRYLGSNPPTKVYTDMLELKGCANIIFRLIKTTYKTLTEELDGDMDTIDDVVKVNLLPAINPQNCLNIWIAENLGNNLLGYAQFPWISLKKNKLKYDGVIIDRAVFGANPLSKQYNQNKTITHEVGHWTGLYHTFQQGNIGSLDSNSVFLYNDVKPGTSTVYGSDAVQEESNGDCIADTPHQQKPTYGNPFKAGKNMTWPSSTEVVKKGNKMIYTKSWHMFMNFMDYSDDEALFMFTKDQVTKMRLMLKMFRPDTVKYNGKPHKI